MIEREGPIGITKIGEKLGIPEHKVRYSLRMLQKEGLILPTSRGASTTEKHDDFVQHLKELLVKINSKTADLQKQLPSKRF